MKYIAKQLMMMVLLMTTATTVWAAGTVTVVKKLNGTTNSSAGTVEQLISNGTCTLTVTPADGNYITVANITAERVVTGGSAQAPRRAGGEPSMDNNITVTAVGSTTDPSGVTRYSFANLRTNMGRSTVMSFIFSSTRTFFSSRYVSMRELLVVL